MKKKRLMAYLIDIILIIMILLAIDKIVPISNKQYEIGKSMNILNENILNKEINFSTYFDEYSKLIYEYDKERILFNIISIIITTIYFVIIPFFTKKTIGQLITKLKITSKKEVTIIRLLIRNMIINGLLYSICLIPLLIFKNNTYYILNIILGIIQILLVIISIFMVIYRRDMRGLHDILSETRIKEEV